MMRDPPHPGAGLTEEIDALRLSVAQAAGGLGVTHRHLSRIIDGDRAIKPEMAFRPETPIGGRADFWLRL